MIYIYYNELKEYKIQIDYTFKVIFNVLGIKYKSINNIKDIYENDILINYGKKINHRRNTINILCGNLFSEHYLTMNSIKNCELKKYNNIPIIYLSGEINPYVKKENQYLVTNIDIIQSIFFMITRYEEVVLYDQIRKDRYGRFPVQESLAYKEKFLDIPIVNIYIQWFMEWINYFDMSIKKNNIWIPKKFAALITHDVDTPFRYTYNIKNDIQKAKYLNKDIIKDIYFHTLSLIDYRYDLFYTFDYIRNIEKKYGIDSSFYFMSDAQSMHDGNYKLKDYRIKNLIKQLELDCCEIGYHYSFLAFDDFNIAKKEKENLDKYLINKEYGGRNHYLKFKSPTTWSIMERLGLLYDTTLSYSNCLGFRCGICTPYKAFDVLENRELNIWEIPLTIMDGTLIEEKYIDLDLDKSIESINKFIEIIEKFNGVFVLLWHNSSFDNEIWKNGKKVFEKTLRLLKNKGAVFLNGRKLIHKLEEISDEKYIDY